MRKNFSGVLFVVGISTGTVALSQETREENISEVKGQIVPDGDRHKYYLDYKQWNISTNPFGLIYGSYSASGSYAFHKNFAVKGDLTIFDSINSSEKGSEVSVSVPVYFRKVYDGFSLEPGIIHRWTRANGKTNSIMGHQVLVGYSWIWDSGLNVSAGMGVGRNWQSSKDGEKVFGNAYLRAGYAFN